MTADIAILAALTPEQLAAHRRVVMATEEATNASATSEQDAAILAAIDALPADHGATVATVMKHMLGFDLVTARAEHDTATAVLAGDDAQAADDADAWLREPHQDDAARDVTPDYWARPIVELLRDAESAGAALSIDADGGLDVGGGVDDIALMMAVSARGDEIRAELYRRAVIATDASDTADAIVRDAAETAAAVAYADTLLSGSGDDAPVSIDAMSGAELLAFAWSHSVAPFLHDGRLFMVSAPDDAPQAVVAALWQRADELTPLVAERGITANDIAALRALRARKD